MRNSGFLHRPADPLSLNGETVLVTGGAGSLGVLLVANALRAGARAVRVLDSNEYGLFRLKRATEALGGSERLRLLVGDISDRDRVRRALEKTDTVFHCAALKNIEISEYNPVEACQTNIMGTAILVEAALEARPSKFIFISSDKAVHHTTLYGATKFCGEKIVLWANQINEHTRFSVVRPPNFRTSRGNVFEIWDTELAAKHPLSITDPEMKRYFIETETVADHIIHVASIMKGGEIFIPQGKTERIMDLVPKGAKTRIIGRRPGEKLEEQLFTEEERDRLTEQEGLLVIKT